MFLLFLMYALFRLNFYLWIDCDAKCCTYIFIGMRMIASGFLMLSYLKVRGITLKVKRCDIVSFLILSIAHIFIPYIGEFWALQFLTAAKVSLIWSLSPFITSIFAWIMFREKRHY